MNRSDKCNQTPLFLACVHNSILLAETLMSNESNPNIITCDETQSNTMCKASGHGNLSMMKCLLNEKKQYKFTFDWVCTMWCLFSICVNVNFCR